MLADIEVIADQVEWKYLCNIDPVCKVEKDDEATFWYKFENFSSIKDYYQRRNR